MPFVYVILSHIDPYDMGVNKDIYGISCFAKLIVFLRYCICRLDKKCDI